jgi:F-type H+-transporting ATPase subunit delta
MAVSEAIARRYARAYFDLAVEAGEVDRRGEELSEVAEVLDDPQVVQALANPRLSVEQRTEVALALLEGRSEPARNLTRLLIQHGRMAALPAVVTHYRRLSDEASGLVRAEVTSAIPVDRGLEERIGRTLSERLGGQVQTSVRQDPSILGGLIIRVGDRVIDGSVRTRLQQLRAALA